ncbi:MAG: phosphoenolpyruvate--protein phosphotransferase [Lachnospiraceae bacterium]|nr:phosphoenolpyruvate--protein phosphotransferase [Lachnospiraceae bacterium]
MEQYQGKTIYPKIAIGTVFLYHKKKTPVQKRHIEDTEAEIVRFHIAIKTAFSQLDMIYQKAEEEAGKDEAAIFQFHKMMMGDENYRGSVCNIIQTEGVNAEYAVAATGETFAGMFAQMDDAYMQARAADVKDISERLITVLSGTRKDIPGTDTPGMDALGTNMQASDTHGAGVCDTDTHRVDLHETYVCETGTQRTDVCGTDMRDADVCGTDMHRRDVCATDTRGTDLRALTEPVILIADDLTPSETVQMDKSKILAFVTRRGSTNSHTAILARTMRIPAVIGVDIQDTWAGKTAIIDGHTGTVILDPNLETLEQMTAKMQEDEEKQQLLQKLRGKETVTKSGRKIHLYANIGSVSDIAQVLENDGEGIGLFRSEFLYLESEDYPTEEAQFTAYKTAAQKMGGKKVIIRTMDIGADKQADYFHLEREDNPAMGYRAIRICLDRQDIFRTQLRALLRASAFGNISIMFPMIISVQEVQECKRILEEEKARLHREAIPYKDVEIGIMIETPAAVWISEELAREVDFFSIGTNDLTQYMLAIDRQNPRLEGIYDSHHPAVLRAIQTVIENGHKGGAWVGICGELATDTTLTQTFLEMGSDELSVAPSFLLPVKQAVRNLD